MAHRSPGVPSPSFWPFSSRFRANTKRDVPLVVRRRREDFGLEELPRSPRASPWPEQAL